MNVKHLRNLLLSAITILVFFWTNQLSADWTFTKVADSNLEIPGQNVPFLFVGGGAYDGDEIIYLASGVGFIGIMATSLESDSTVIVVDNSTQVPGLGLTTFDSFTSGGTTTIDDDNVIFQGTSTTIGIYLKNLNQSAIQMIVDSNTEIVPAGVTTFTNPSNPTINNNSIAFNDGINAIYRTDLNASSFEKIVDATDQIPGTGILFAGVGRPAIDDDMVAFIGEGPVASNTSGVFLFDDSQLSTLVDNSTNLPNSVETFSSFERIVTLNDDAVTFIAEGSGGSQGIYSYDIDTQAITTIVDSQAQVPSGLGNFSNLGRGASTFVELAADDSQHLFTAQDDGRPSNADAGIYYSDEQNNIFNVINESNLLNGEEFSNPSIVSGSMDDGDFVIEVTQLFGGLFDSPVIYFAKQVQSGDINLDGTVDEADVAAFVQNLGKTSNVLRATGDLDLDGKVTLKDLLILKRNFNRSLNDQLSPSPVAVPESSTLCLLLISLGCFISRKLRVINKQNRI